MTDPAHAAATLGRWPVAVDLPVQWGDMDAFQHVNNTVYLRWFETARIAYFERTGLSDRAKRSVAVLLRKCCRWTAPVCSPTRM